MYFDIANGTHMRQCLLQGKQYHLTSHTQKMTDPTSTINTTECEDFKTHTYSTDIDIVLKCTTQNQSHRPRKLPVASV